MLFLAPFFAFYKICCHSSIHEQIRNLRRRARNLRLNSRQRQNNEIQINLQESSVSVINNYEIVDENNNGLPSYDMVNDDTNYRLASYDKAIKDRHINIKYKLKHFNY